MKSPARLSAPAVPDGGGAARGWPELALMALLVMFTASMLVGDRGAEMPGAWSWAVSGVAGMGLTVAWWRADRIGMPVVLLGALGLRLAMLPFPPLLSDDFYRYLWDGLVQHAGDNPYRHLPADPRYADLHGSVEFRHMNSRNYHSVYPPVSQMIFYLSAALRDWGFYVSYVALKFQWMILEFAGIAALSRMVRARDVMLYAWNPLVVIALVGQGHTEAGMIGAVLLTVYFVRRGCPGAASLTLAAAGWIKLYPFLLFPFLVSRFGWKRTWPGIAAAAAVGGWYFDFETGRNLVRSLDLYLSYFSYNAGPYFVLRELGWELGRGDPRPAISVGLAAVFAFAVLTIWWFHRRGKLRFEVAALMVFGAYLACGRTIHPWYLGGVFALLPFVRPVWRWPWLWLGGGAWGTYLFYVDGTYWPFVWLGWIGWTLGMAVAALSPSAAGTPVAAGIHRLLRRRARAKAEVLRPALAAIDRSEPRRALELLDLGAAEGYLGDYLARDHGARVELIDIENRCRVDLPHHVYDGRDLPFPERRFDVAVCYFVLHHADDPRRVLAELRRVVSKRVILVESWGRTPLRRRLLRWLDRGANRLRGGGWSDPIHYRSIPEWTRMAGELGYRIADSRDLGGWLHAKLYLELDAWPEKSESRTRSEVND